MQPPDNWPWVPEDEDRIAAPQTVAEDIDDFVTDCCDEFSDD